MSSNNDEEMAPPTKKQKQNEIEILQLQLQLAKENRLLEEERRKTEEERRKTEEERRKTEEERRKTEEVKLRQEEERTKQKLLNSRKNDSSETLTSSYADVFNRIVSFKWDFEDVPITTVSLDRNLLFSDLGIEEKLLEDYKKEPLVQSDMHTILLQMLDNRTLSVHDTHKHYFLGDSNKSPDFTFSSNHFIMKTMRPLNKVGVMVGEVKNSTINISMGTILGQVMSYLQDLQQQQKNYRTVFYGFVTNMKAIIFLKSNSDSIGVTKSYDFMKEGLQHLYSLLCFCDDNSKKFYSYIDSNITLRNCIGEGATSIVFSTEKKDQVIKLSKNEDQLDFFQNEIKWLTILENIKGIPKPLETGDWFIILPRFKPIEIDNITKDQCLQLIETLKTVHNKKICHRDIRPGNILLQNDTLMIIDWGFACVSESKVSFAGTISFGANEYLHKSFSSITPYTHAPITPYLPRYDCESLLKTFCFWFDKENIFTFTGDVNDKVNKALSFWDGYNKLNYQSILAELKKKEDIHDVLKTFFTLNTSLF